MIEVAEQLDETKAQAELREILLEQHQGKWIFSGSETDKEGLEKHEAWVSSRVCRGIELTAFLRGIQAAPAKAKGKSNRSSKESIAAAITEDLLS